MIITTKLTRKYTPFQLQKLVNHIPISHSCPICKEQFDAQSYIFRPTAIYPYLRHTCSDKCKRIFGGRKNKRIIKTYGCAHCKETFVPHKNKPHQKFCSSECFADSMTGKPRPEVLGWLFNKPRKGHPVSKQGTKWLSQFKLTNVEYKLIVGKKYFIVDGFDATTNTVYEYLGSFWHGNPKKYKKEDINPLCKLPYGELYKRTMKRLKAIRRGGYLVRYEWS